MRKGNLKKILSFVLSLVMVLGLCTSVKMDKVQAADGVVFTVTADKTDVKRGDEVTVTVTMSGNTEGRGLRWIMTYDSSKMEGINIGETDDEGNQEATIGDLGGSVRSSSHNPGEVTVAEACVGTKKLKKDGIVMETKFKIVENATLGELPFTYRVELAASADTPLLTNYSIDDQTKLNVIAPATNISLETSTTIAKGTTKRLTANLTPADSNSTVAWSSTNEGVASVAQDGNVTANAVGKAIIIATAEGHSASCEVEVTNPLKGITITSKDKVTTLKKGQKTQLNVTYDPEDTTDSKEVTWTSSDEKVATVDSNGVVTAIADGTTTIKATVGDKTATYDITVEEVKLRGISLGKSVVTVHRGGTDTLTVSYNPENTTDDKKVDWTSSNPSVVSVDGNGKITALKAGTAVITAKVGNYTATCTVTVDVPLTGITPENATIELVKNQTAQVNYKLNPEDTTVGDKTVSFASDDTNVATVDENGKVTAISEGSAKITITSNADENIAATVTVKVKEIPINSVTLDKVNAIVEKGETTTLKATINPADTTDDDKTITWYSLNEEIATVDPKTSESGATVTVKAVSGGTATITATTKNGKTASCKIKVPVHTESIEITGFNEGLVDLNRGETRVLNVKFNPENTDDSKEVTWTSSKPEIATVDATGTVKALKAGTTEITATTKDGRFFAKKLITVNEKHLDTETSENIKFDKKEEIKVYVGQAQSMNTYFNLNKFLEENGITDDVTVNWSVSDESVATIDQNGTLTCLKKGTVTVTATVVAKDGEGQEVGTYVYSTEVEIKDIPLTAIKFSKIIKEMKVGAKETISILYDPENTTDAKDVTWTSSDPSVISVENGTLTALKAGKATITATVGEKKVSMEITVTENQAGAGTGDKNTGNKGASGKGGKGADGKAANDNKSVNTGDTTHVFIYMVMLFVSGIAAMFLMLRKERRHSHRR